MTIITIIRCDGDNCHCSLEVDECDSVSTTLKAYEWHQDPEDGFAQFCSDCWPERKAYLDEHGLSLGDDE